MWPSSIDSCHWASTGQPMKNVKIVKTDYVAARRATSVMEAQGRFQLKVTRSTLLDFPKLKCIFSSLYDLLHNFAVSITRVDYDLWCSHTDLAGCIYWYVPRSYANHGNYMTKNAPSLNNLFQEDLICAVRFHKFLWRIYHLTSKQ